MKSISFIAKRQGVVLNQDAQRLLNEVQGENNRSQDFFSIYYPVDLDATPNDLTAASMGKLVEDFEGQKVDKGKETEDAMTSPDWEEDAASMFLTFMSDNDDVV